MRSQDPAPTPGLNLNPNEQSGEGWSDGVMEWWINDRFILLLLLLLFLALNTKQFPFPYGRG